MTLLCMHLLERRLCNYLTQGTFETEPAKRKCLQSLHDVRFKHRYAVVGLGRTCGLCSPTPRNADDAEPTRSFRSNSSADGDHFSRQPCFRVQRAPRYWSRVYVI